MLTCPSCAHAVLEDALFCSACGASLIGSSTSTKALAELSQSTSPPDVKPILSPQGAFITGAKLAGRYRIVSLLGKGGMGEVYRAEDLKLQQTVALKFLPAAIALDGGTLARFHNEVRIARQVSHPSVCRVYDIGEVGGRHFLSMEFIDGEDLSVLLRRIGRLPGDKALELTRQICGGLAAAHEVGVVHRDLKPANIMIDGRGKARITDFGLAVVSEELHNEEGRPGTPAYMAPEQLMGKEVTTRSDIFALGLVLYELFTGKRVFVANSMQELMQLHMKPTPPPSSHVTEIDPLVERVIMWCLEEDPQSRPGSAIQVAAALPGGDPLAAALAAGEMPSPEMVAAAGEKTGLRPPLAIFCLIAIIVGLLVIAFLSSKTSLVGRMPLENPPDVLAYKAREVISRLGYPARPLDTAYGFVYDDDYLRYIRGGGDPATWWRRLLTERPAAIQFWYRESPQYLEPDFVPSLNGQLRAGRITRSNPPPIISGMASAVLDPQGRLIAFSAVPQQFDASSSTPPLPEWTALFSAAGLDATHFTPAEPQWTPLVACDARAAWTGVYPEQPEIPLRIETAAYRGRPVYFQMIAPWTMPSQMPAVQPSGGQRVSYGVFVGIIVLVTLGAALLARHNLRLRWGDRRGAFRLGFFIFSVVLLTWLFGASHTPTVHEGETYLLAISQALFVGISGGLLYLALEPYVRRRWPETLIAWSRVLEGRFGDQLVGRDILVGILLAVIMGLLISLFSWLSSGIVPSKQLYAALGARHLVAFLLTATSEAVLSSGVIFFLIFLLRVLFRIQWLAAGVPILLFAAVSSLAAISVGINPVLGLLGGGLAGALHVVALIRFGLLSLITLSWGAALLGPLPFTTDLTAWYAGSSILALATVLALTGFAFYTSLGRQKLP